MKTPALASNWYEMCIYSEDGFIADNTEMLTIVAADQADRSDNSHIDYSGMRSADEGRRQRAVSLLREGQLHTAKDFEGAAYVLQHGSTPDDFLLAHALAMAALAKGDVGAIWIASATLDRYLQASAQPQIFGTQFKLEDERPATQDPYNRSLVPDLLRLQLGIPIQAEQEDQLAKYDRECGIELKRNKGNVGDCSNPTEPHNE